MCGDQGQRHIDICLDCQADLPTQKEACYRCALPLAGIKGGSCSPHLGVLTGDSMALCGRCLNDPPSYDSTLSVFRYAHPVDQLIHGLKFNHKLHIARLLGTLMAKYITKHVQTRPELIIPVPLHAVRLHERGYNQATELARPIARALSIPIDYQHCQRRRATAVQSDLPAKERSRNVKGVFSVARELRARHVAIVDDVMTTGATVAELSAALRKAGVEKIDIWVCARAALLF